ncbi:hydrolase, NUDIX family [Acetomicrobium hydrogeniformans ATCC BAA-1850]|uniref:NAD(+) diphosphatase n=1 Tax=Acetomicrobium hydrogeniformans ATCC BAA-1850 TaxID=592015 RepID=A0A0T5XFH2_9BACT|nr:hydrolase, NUDIX family [Acetomicrobium hydrogeniformans ATCC BAA-1850]
MTFLFINESRGSTVEQIWYIFKGNELVVCHSSAAKLPTTSDIEIISDKYVNKGVISIGDRDKSETPNEFWAEIPSDVVLPSGMITVGLREVGSLLGEQIFYRAARAYQLMNWSERYVFCMSCGDRLEPSLVDNCKTCPTCGSVFYPPVSPAVIVAVEREGKILLARNASFPPKRYSVIAGFVEPGESFEDAVRREVREEVSIEVKDIKYFGSQPWPFPHSIMVGFTAKWASGELEPDGREILDAGWFSPNEMPDLPPGVSIARKLIDNFRHSRSVEP